MFVFRHRHAVREGYCKLVTSDLESNLFSTADQQHVLMHSTWGSTIEDDFKMALFPFSNLKNTHMQRNISEAVNQRDHQLSRGRVSLLHTSTRRPRQSRKLLHPQQWVSTTFSNYNWVTLSDERMRWRTNWSWLVFLHAGMWENTKVINFWFLTIKHVMSICWHGAGPSSQPPFDSFAVPANTVPSNILFVFSLLWSCNRLRLMVFLWYWRVELGHIWWISYLYQCTRQTLGSCWALPWLDLVLCISFFIFIFLALTWNH